MHFLHTMRSIEKSEIFENSFRFKDSEVFRIICESRDLVRWVDFDKFRLLLLHL